MIHGRFVNSNNPDDTGFSDNIIKEVFVKELGISSSYDDGVMNNRLLAISTEGGNPDGTPVYVGAGRLTYDLDYFVIDNVCVLKDYRFKGYGDFIVRILTDKAMQCGADAIYAYCPKNTSPLFEKIGFKRIDFENNNCNKTLPPCYGIKFPDDMIKTVLYKLKPADFCTKCGSKG